MKRLTERMLGGVVLPEIPMEIKNKEDLEKFHHARKIYEENTIKLAAYEDTGFSPEELQQLVNQQKWHVVADGDLPEEKGQYLLQMEVTNSKIMPFMIGFYRSKSRTFPLENHYHHILAWRELPEPWEGENNE